DGFMNIDTDSWLYCDKHNIAWYAGSYVSTSMYRENPTIWEANRVRLKGYTIIDPCQAVFDDEQHKVDSVAGELLDWLELGETRQAAQPANVSHDETTWPAWLSGEGQDDE